MNVKINYLCLFRQRVNRNCLLKFNVRIPIYNMELEKIVNDLRTLPDELQKEAADFIAFLRTRNTVHNKRKPKKSLNLKLEPFIGMWKDRGELKDSSAWVKTIRQTEWQ